MTDTDAIVDEMSDSQGAENVQPEENSEGTDTENVNPEENEQQEKNDQGGGSDDNVPFPKKARNAISYRDKKIAKLQSQLNEFKQAQEKQPEQQGAQDSAPKEEDFETYSDFLEAKILHKMKQGQAQEQQPQAQQQQPEQDPQVLQMRQQKEQSMMQQAQQYAQKIPDYAQVVEQNAEVLDYMPQEIQDAFYEADDAALAFYNLAKSGDLYTLAEMTPYRAAMVIAQAQQQPNTPQQPQAPQHKPMKGVGGANSQASTGLNAIKNDPDKLMKWLNS